MPRPKPMSLLDLRRNLGQEVDRVRATAAPGLRSPGMASPPLP